jgi:hypothetical protein
MDLTTIEKGQVYKVGTEDYFYVAGISEHAVHLVHISQQTVLIPNLCVQKENLENQSGELTELSLSDLELSDNILDKIENLEEAIKNKHPDAVPDKDEF